MGLRDGTIVDADEDMEVRDDVSNRSSASSSISSDSSMSSAIVSSSSFGGVGGAFAGSPSGEDDAGLVVRRGQW